MSLYLPPQFASKDPAHAFALMRAYPFATLISNDNEGFPFITHLPLHLDTAAPQGEPPFVLLGHVARPNPHWRYLEQRPDALVVFMGPYAYQSPKVYADLQRVPTWNYLTVHCRVQARLIHEPIAKDRLLKKLIGDHEPPYADQWRGLDSSYAEKMLSGIVAFELEVQALQCKLKLNQHRPESHAAMHQIYSAGNEQERALAHWMSRLNLSG